MPDALLTMPTDPESTSEPITLKTPIFDDYEQYELPGLQLSISAETGLSGTLAPHLSLEDFAEGVIQLWPSFVAVATREGVFDILGIRPEEQAIAIELSWVSNPGIQSLNRDYREKDAATDVLSFTLLADSAERSMWLSLPEVQLGSIFVSLPWAEDAIPAGIPSRRRQVFHYVMERVIHGFLHLHGHHHDTMPDFEHVVAIQQQVLLDAFGTADL